MKFLEWCVQQFGVADGGEVLGFCSREVKVELGGGGVISQWPERAIENERER